MSVNDVILFVSSTSRASGPVVQFIRQNEIPVKIVRLDTIEDRESAANGKYFQIVNVPTLLVMYTDNNIQLFVSQEKVIAWFQQLIQRNKSHEEHRPVSSQQYPAHVSSSEEDEEEEIPKRRKKKSSLKKIKVPPLSSKKPISDKSHKKKKRSYNEKPSKKKKKKPIQFEESYSEDSEESYSGDSEDEIKYYEEEEKPSGNSTEGLTVGPQSLGKRNSQMVDIKDIAEKMKKERQQSLGYKEDELPRGT